MPLPAVKMTDVFPLACLHSLSCHPLMSMGLLLSLRSSTQSVVAPSLIPPPRVANSLITTELPERPTTVSSTADPVTP